MGKGKVDLEELFLNVVRVSLRFNCVFVWGNIVCFFRCVFNFVKKRVYLYIFKFLVCFIFKFFGFIKFYVVYNNL